MYQVNNRVHYTELGSDGKMSILGLINQFQNCSTFHSEDIGLGLEYLLKKQKAWILSSWQIEIRRMPELGEEVVTGTWATGFKGIYGTRNFIIKDSKDEILAWANSIWIFMDLAAGRPVRPDMEEMSGYEVEPALDQEFAPRKIKTPSGGQCGEPFPVRRYHLDTNRHVNNGQYVNLAAEYIPESCKVRQVRAEYRKSAVLGDVMVPWIHMQDDLYTVVLKNKEDEIFAVVEFKEQ